MSHLPTTLLEQEADIARLKVPLARYRIVYLVETARFVAARRAFAEVSIEIMARHTGDALDRVQGIIAGPPVTLVSVERLT